MKQGVLFFDTVLKRYDFQYDIEKYYGGLHCGECFEVLLNGKWIHTRIELDNDWYLAGLKNISISGLRIRMC